MTRAPGFWRGMASAARLMEQCKCYSYEAEGACVCVCARVSVCVWGGGDGHKRAMSDAIKKERKNRSVKVHGREVKQFPFEKETKEYRGGTSSSASWMRERETEVELCKHSGCPKHGPSPTFLKNDPASLC